MFNTLFLSLYIIIKAFPIKNKLKADNNNNTKHSNDPPMFYEDNFDK